MLSGYTPFVTCLIRSCETKITSRDHSGLQIDVFSIETCDLPSNILKVTNAIASPLAILMNEPWKLGYALYRGEVFKGKKPSKYTYQHCCSLKKNVLCWGEKNTIVNHLSNLAEILGNKECEFIKQLRINYDLKEVNGDWCFSVTQQKFLCHVTSDSDIGMVPPRVYVNYDHAKVPEPRYLKEILENSIDQTEIGYFCECYSPSPPQKKMTSKNCQQWTEGVFWKVGLPYGFPSKLLGKRMLPSSNQWTALSPEPAQEKHTFPENKKDRWYCKRKLCTNSRTSGQWPKKRRTVTALETGGHRDGLEG